MLNAVLRVRSEAEDARRVLAESAAHRPPVEPGPHKRGSDPGGGKLSLSTRKLAKSVNGVTGGRTSVPTRESGLEANLHSMFAQQLESGLKLPLKQLLRVGSVLRMLCLEVAQNVVDIIARGV